MKLVANAKPMTANMLRSQRAIALLNANAATPSAANISINRPTMNQLSYSRYAFCNAFGPSNKIVGTMERAKPTTMATIPTMPSEIAT